MSNGLDFLKTLGEDPEPTEKEIKVAQQWKHCPFCKGRDFRATFELAGRDFWVGVRDGIIWAKREKDAIETVECHICGEEIPEEVWKKHWGLEG